MERELPTAIEISRDLYRLLQRRADEVDSTPQQVAETIIRLQLGSTVHIEQRPTPYGLHAYVRGTRVAVRHIAAFLKAGFTAEEIIGEGLPHVTPAAIREAIAYYYAHQQEIEAELQADSVDAAFALLRERLTPNQLLQLTHQSAS